MSDDLSNNQTAKYFPSLTNPDYEQVENFPSDDDGSKSGEDDLTEDFTRREAMILGTDVLNLASGHFGRPMIAPKVRNFPHPEIQSDDDEMELSDGARSDDDFASTSKYVEDFSEVFKDADDIPQQALTRLYTRSNGDHWPISVDPDDEFSRLLDCAYYLVVKNMDSTPRMAEFLKLAHFCFEKLLLTNMSRSWNEIQHRNCWLLCAQFVKLFATKLKMVVTSNDSNMNPYYFAIAYSIFTDNSVFNSHSSKLSAHSMPCHVDDIELMPRCTIYSHNDLYINDYQQFRMLFYVFAKYDGFDNLKRFIEQVLVYSLEFNSFMLVKICADFLLTITSFMNELFASMTCYLINKSILLFEKTSDEQWNYKAIGEFRESPLLQHLMLIKNLSTIVFNKRLMDKNDVRRIDSMQLKALLKTIQFAKLTGRTAAIEELQRLLLNVSMASNTIMTDPTMNISRTFDELVSWIRENDVCGILLRDNLHLVAFVERIEKVFEILLKRNAIRTQDLEQMWAASWGKHDVVQRNMIMMISRLARFLSNDLIQRLFELVKGSFRKTSSNREKALLLEFIKCLVSNQTFYNVSNIIYRKVYDLTWELYEEPNLSSETIEILLTTQLQSINNAKNSEELRKECFYNCLARIKQDSLMVVPLFMHIWYCVSEVGERKKRYSTSKLLFNFLVHENIANVFIESLCRYLKKVSEQLTSSEITMPIENPNVIFIGNNYTHRNQVFFRIEGLSRFIIECSERDYYPECSDLENLWKALIENPVSEFERQTGFNFFGTNLGRFDSQTNMELFQSCLMNFPPKYFTVSSFNEICHMLKRSTGENLVNTEYSNCYSQVMGPNLFNDYIVKARNYVWRCILEGSESLCFRSIEFATCEMDNMSDATRRNASAQLFIDECYRKLKDFNRDLHLATSEELKGTIASKIQRVVRALRILLIRYDNSYKNRWHPPLYRAPMGRCFNVLFMMVKDDRSNDYKRQLSVNANFTLKQLYQQIYRIATNDRKLRPHEKMDLLTYRVPPGLVLPEAVVRVAQLVNSMKNDKISSVNTNFQDILRYCGKESMRRTLSESHIDENTIFTARFTRSRRDTTTYTFVTSMTRGDTPESSNDEISDDDDNLATDDDFEMKPIILSQNQPRIFFLMDLADMAHKQNYESLRDEIVSLLDRLTVTDSLRKELEKAMYMNQLMDHVVFESPTRTCFYFQLIHAFLTPVRFNENFYQFEIMFLSKNCIEKFLEFFTSKIIDRKGYFPSLNARMLLSFARMVKYVSLANLKLMQHYRSDGSIDIADTAVRDDDSYFSNFVSEVLGMEQVHRATIAQYSDNYLVSLTVLKTLLFSSWSAFRCSISIITCRNAPMTNIESQEEEIMEIESVVSDSDSTISSFQEDLTFSKMNDKNDPLCETLAFEALDAFLIAAKYCPEVCTLFHTPKHLLTGGTIVNEETSNNPSFYEYAIDGMLFGHSDVLRNKIARSFFIMHQNFPETHGEDGPKANALLDVMFANLPIAEIRFQRSQRYFECLYQLLNSCQKEGIPLNNPEQKFNQIKTWLEKTKIATHEMGSTFQREELLIPYLKLAMHFLRLSPRNFVEEVGESGFLTVLFDDFLMPFTKALTSFETEDDMLRANANASPATSENNLLIQKPNKILPICRTDCAVNACFSLILELVRECPKNMDRSLKILYDYFYEDAEPFGNLEPPPAFLPRDPTVFVGLKNAGATCYMNSVLQQLFMIEPFRQMIMDAPIEIFKNMRNGIDSDKKQHLIYGRDLIHAVQSVFANLLASDEQFHVPIEFWDTFQFGGRDVNTREQQDALEFFTSLADALDESFKAMGGTSPFEKFFGGTFADQKKCKDCPHTFSTEQLFTSIAVDIRSHNNLLLSLNEYVTGDLLEGDNAYFCEICKEKVTAVKRLCIQKLPPFLVFQLKRFDMDWNRGSPIKFFDYFNFPMTLDMEPFTTTGVEKRENSPRSNSINCDSEQSSTMYRLRGVVVHSGEANGGHYYSFIADIKEDGKQQWYRFDDTEVTAWDHNELEAKINWFGGYNENCLPTEKDKKRFSAYMLVYESIPMESVNLQQVSSSTNRSVSVHSPSPIPSPNVNSVDVRFGSMSLHSKRSIANRLPYYWERIVTKNNLKFAQERFQFNGLYYRFLRDLLRISALQTPAATNIDRIIVIKRTLHILSTFLYTTAIRNPYEIRRSMNDWIQTFDSMIGIHPEILIWFMDTTLCKKNVIHQTLLAPLVAVNDLRQILETMIKSPIFHSLNLLENDGLDPTYRSIIDALVDAVISKIVQTSKTLNAEFWNNGHNVLRLLIVISNYSVFGARRLIAQNLLYALVTWVGQRDDKTRSLREGELIFELLTSMLTSCTGIIKPKKNPYARKSLTPYYLTDNISTWFQNYNNVGKLFLSMLEHTTDVKISITLACYLCWNNIIASTKLLSALNYRTNDTNVQVMLKIFKAVIEIKDDCQLERIRIGLFGHEATKIKGLLTEAASLQLNSINRIILLALDFVTLWDAEPIVQKAIHGHSSLENCIKTIRTNIMRGSENRSGVSRPITNQFSSMIPRIIDTLNRVLEENEKVLTSESSTSISTVSQSSQSKTSETGSQSSTTTTAPPSYETATSSNSKESNSTNSVQENHDFGLSTSPIIFRCLSRRDFCDSSNHPENNDDCIGMTDEDEFEADDENDDDEELQAMQEILGCSDPQALANIPSFFNDGHDGPLTTPKKALNTLQKAGKKRHFHPPTSSHGSNSSLPSYDGMPTSRKVRHAQSPNTSPVKFPFNPLPSYDECIRSDSLSPMQVNEEEPASSTNYTGHYSSDGPPSV